ncbi:MAG: bifunctional homocysteine S-methyltransferase/methylenetetrahydrofolate reductase [candidate division Zixibacteria bacterium]|nr:bifunctional homocysteine S-methyltransferase/methylenetetrahydrofolate reductase [candidate division Zixibacteria bacterium]
MADTFRERLQKGPILCDGAMGTLLFSRGVPYEHCFDEINLSNPKLVQQIHQDYIHSGAEIIETNTFGANFVKLATHGLEDKVRDINFRGAKIAREAREIVGKLVFVAGSIGPLGKPLEPIGKITSSQAQEYFRKQAEGLLEGGVDLFMVETMVNLEEMKQAILAVKKICQLPVVAQMTFAEDGNTLMGLTPEEVVAELEKLKVDVIGANCSVGPQGIFEIIRRMSAATKVKLSAQPNAGLPRLIDGRFIYFTSPEYFGEYAGKFISAGAGIIGGCCGTTPEHIAAMGSALDSLSRSEKQESTTDEIRVELPKTDRVETPPAKPEEISEFARKLKQKKFVISVELDPPKGVNPEKLLKGAEAIKKAGADACNIGDSPMARVRMSCLALAYLIKDRVGLDVVLHFTPRDRNLMGIQSDLVGAHALGVKNILCITGDPPSLGDYAHATAVYDVDSIGLTKIISKLNQGTDVAGNSIGSPTSFFIGVGVNPGEENLARELDRFRRKLDSGAHYVFTQILYDVSILEKFLKQVGRINVPVVLGILPLHSYKHAEFLHNEVPGITIPDKLRERMRMAGEKGAVEGFTMAKEIFRQAKGMVDGVYLMPSYGRYQEVLEIVEDVL